MPDRNLYSGDGSQRPDFHYPQHRGESDQQYIDRLIRQVQNDTLGLLQAGYTYPGAPSREGRADGGENITIPIMGPGRS